MSTPTNTDALNRNFGGAALLLATAESAGLPAPFALRIDEWSINLSVREEDIADWATFMEEPISRHGNVDTVEANLLGFDVHIGAVITEPSLSLVGA